MSSIYNMAHYVMTCFQTVSRGQVLVFFNIHSTTMNLVKEKQGGPILMGLESHHAYRPGRSIFLVFHHLLQFQQAAVL